MTIQSAITFIRTGQQDRDLRQRLVQAPDPDAITAELKQAGFDFTPGEFEEAHSLTLFKCQEAEEAEALGAFRMWWLLLLGSFEQIPATEEEK